MHVHMERLKPVTMQCGTLRPRTTPKLPALEDIVPLVDIIGIQKRHDERRKPAIRPQLDIRDCGECDGRLPEQERRQPSVEEPKRGVCIMSM